MRYNVAQGASMTRMKYRGSDPPPKYSHGELIPGFGKVVSRKRIHSGWEYGCRSEACMGTLPLRYNKK